MQIFEPKDRKIQTYHQITRFIEIDKRFQTRRNEMGEL